MRSLRIVVATFALVSTVSFGAGGCSDSASEHLGENAASLTANDKAAYDYFIGKGLTGPQAAGIIGNLDIESGMDPTIVESGGPGRGIAQWSAGGRWDTTAGDNVLAYAKMQGRKITWLSSCSSSSSGSSSPHFRTTASRSSAPQRPSPRPHPPSSKITKGAAACDSSARAADGEMVLAAYGSDVPTDGGPAFPNDASTADPCTLPATGETGECLTTDACEALGNHVSTPGLCPGAADIQCCTAVASDGGASTSDGGALSPTGPGRAGTSSDDSTMSNGGCAVSSIAGRAAAHETPENQASFALVAISVAALFRRRSSRRRARTRMDM